MACVHYSPTARGRFEIEQYVVCDDGTSLPICYSRDHKLPVARMSNAQLGAADRRLYGACMY